MLGEPNHALNDWIQDITFNFFVSPFPFVFNPWLA